MLDRRRNALLLFVISAVSLLRAVSLPAATLEYASYFGKGGTTAINDIKRDANGYIYLAGQTAALSGFPVTTGAYDTSYNGGTMDAFVAKISPANALVFCTFLGGSGEDKAASLAIDAAGNIYVTGTTYSANFPTTSGAYDRSIGGERDAFAAKISADGRTLAYSTYIGGTHWDYGHYIVLDSSANAYIGGSTHSADFPVTASGAQRTFGGRADGFVVKLNPAGSARVYATYIGGVSWDGISGLCLDVNRNLYIAGDTQSNNFPVTAGAYDTNTARLSEGISSIGYAAKLNAAGSRFRYSTIVGGKGTTGGGGMTAVTVDSAGRAFITGQTNRTDYPVTTGAFQKTFGGGALDAVVTKLNATGTGLLWSTYLGGSGDDKSWSIALDPGNAVFVSGATSSSDFPLAGEPFQSANRGGFDAFLAKLSKAGPSLVAATYLGGAGDEGDPVRLAPVNANIAIAAGRTSSADFPVSADAQQLDFGGGASCGFISKIDVIKTSHINQPPVARAGRDTFIETDSPDAAVTLDGTGSYDPDSWDAVVSYTWRDRSGSVVATGPAPTLTLPRGIHYLYLTVNDGALDSPEVTNDAERDSLVIIVVSEGVYRINCGADTFDLSDPRGRWWMKDEAFYSLYRWGNIGGNTSGVYAGGIFNTDNPDIYRTHRWGGPEMHYKLEVPNGLYAVKLMFAETNFKAPGMRSFDVSVEGSSVLTYVDLYAWRGFATPYENTFYISVRDGCLDIDFPKVHKDKALISAIEVATVDVTEDAFLDFMQKKMFWYFWNECDPATGHVKDKERNFEQDSEVRSSIAATGLGLSAITVAVNRGWITREQGYQRVKTTLDSFLSPPVPNSKEGFWYHFLDMRNGERMAYDDGRPCEVSTVDSGLLILGALQAAEYFKSVGYDPDNIYGKADTLYRNMNWKYYTNRGSDFQDRFVNMGWYPENGGHFTGGFWESYCESVFVNLLAIGAPKEAFRVSTDAWSDMGRDFGDYFGYMHAKQAPLFTHQYHHLWFDLRNTDDGRMDYFETSKFATHTNRLACVKDGSGRYEPNAWGVTACFGLDGNYYVYGAPEGFHDGTIAPTAAGASIMFTPGKSMKAMRRMYFAYKQWTWGKHGFADSFKTGENKKCIWSLGLDNGPIILGIENYRTGLIRDTAMKNPHLQAALKRCGFQPGSTRPLAFASSRAGAWESTDPALVSPEKAFDGDMDTRWDSHHATDTEWLCVDYRTPRTVNKVTIDWEAAYATAYKLQTSLDGHSWTDVYATAAGDGGTDVAVFAPVQARFVRLFCTKHFNPAWGYSVWEMKVENANENVALKKRASASSYATNPVRKPAYAFDGLTAPGTAADANKYWCSLAEYHPWLRVDLGDVTWVNRVVLFWGVHKGASYRIQTSVNGKAWSIVTPDASGNFAPRQARYVRLYGNEATPKIYSLWEMRVFGVPTGSTYSAAPESGESAAPIDAVFKQGDVFAFPNPAKGGQQPTIHAECGIADRVEIRIYDVAGNEIHAVEINSPPGVVDDRYAYEYIWDTSGVASGVYLYRVSAYQVDSEPISVLKKLALIK